MTPDSSASSSSPIPLEWSSLLPGTLVYVTERNGYSYRAYIDTKTDMADIIWVRRHDVGTRHLLDPIDGAVISYPPDHLNGS